MKFNKLWIPIAFITIVALAALWKLNDFYRQDRMNTMSKALEQQASFIQTSVSEYLNTRKTLVAGFENGIVETNINWLQFKPFFIVARGEVKDGKINFSEAVVNSDSIGRAWSAPFLNQALSFFKFGDDSISTKLFKNKSGQKFLALTFQYPQLGGPTGGRVALTLVTEAEVLQKFFLSSQGSDVIHSLVTADQIVAAHTSATYVATVSNEKNRQRKKEIKKVIELRGTDLTLVSYVASHEEAQGIVIPASIIGIVVGACMVLIGILVFAYAPLEAFWLQQKNKTRSEEYQKTLEESKEQLGLVASVDDETQPENSQKPSKRKVVSVEADDSDFDLAKMTSDLEGVGEVKMVPSSNSVLVSNTKGDSKQPDVSSVGSIGFYDLGELIERAVLRLSPQFKEFRIEVVKKIQANAKVEVDPDRFIKAVTNLLQNSIEAVKDRTRREIEVAFFESGSGVRLTIHDSGLGFKPEDVDRIWQPFFTSKNKKVHKGLGLSEAISIARRYGFDLQVTNSPKGGVLAEMIIEPNATKHEYPAALKATESISNVDVQTQNDQQIEDEIEKILNLEDETLAQMKPIHFKMEEESSPELEIMPSTPRVPPPGQTIVMDLDTSITAVDFVMPDLNVQADFAPDIEVQMKVKAVDEIPIVIRRPQMIRDSQS